MGPTAGLGVLEREELLASVGVQTLYRNSPPSVFTDYVSTARDILHQILPGNLVQIPRNRPTCHKCQYWGPRIMTGSCPSENRKFPIALSKSLKSTMQNINPWRADTFPVGDVTSAFRTPP